MKQGDDPGELARLAEQLVGQRAARELVPRDPRSSVRWHMHDYPGPYARWNYHPELEIHLIREGTGRYIVGDSVGVFRPGQLVLVGPNLPHDWISDIEPGEVIVDRDIVLQFDSEWLEACQHLLPELRGLDALLTESRRGIEFTGASAAEAAQELALVGLTEGTERLRHVFALFDVLARAPKQERRVLAREWFNPSGDGDIGGLMARALEHLLSESHTEARASTLAASLGLSLPAFSRAFKRASGMTFSEMSRQLRLARACHLLERGNATVASVSHAVGYSNLSNFNRQFRREFGQTPSDYRRAHQRSSQ